MVLYNIEQQIVFWFNKTDFDFYTQVYCLFILYLFFKSAQVPKSCMPLEFSSFISQFSIELDLMKLKTKHLLL